MTEAPIPTPLHPVSTWVWYVSGGRDRTQRNERLAACPEDKQEAVEEWVKVMFKESQKARRK